MRTSSIVGLTVVLAVGCQSEATSWKDEYDFVWHGEHVSVYGYERAEEDACGGSLAALDTNTAAILEFIGADDSLHYDYRWMSDAFWTGRCPLGSIACASFGEPWTRSVPDMHESTHAIIYDAWGRCSRFLGEGLAEYFSEPRRRHAALPEPGRARELLTGHLRGDDDYNVAGHFASFMIEEFGPEAVEHICRILPLVTSIDDWENAFDVVLGKQVDEVLAEYAAYPICDQQQYRARLGECDGDVDVVYDGDETVFAVNVDCSDERVLGPVGDKSIAIRRVWFTEDTVAEVMVRWGNDPGSAGRFMSQECVPCSESPQVFEKMEGPDIYPFRAGMHEFIFWEDLDVTVPMIVRVGPP